MEYIDNKQNLNQQNYGGQNSAAVILKAEADILDCMEDLFCENLKPGIEGLLSVGGGHATSSGEPATPSGGPATPSGGPASGHGATIDKLREVSKVLKEIMCGYTAKEMSIAEVIKALAKKEAADNGINPCELECNGKCNKCC